MCPDRSLDRSKVGKTYDNSEISKIKKQIEAEDRIFDEEIVIKYFMLEKLNLEELKVMCNEMLGRDPHIEHYKDESSGKNVQLPQYREDYIYFIIDELRLSDIKNYVSSKKL